MISARRFTTIVSAAMLASLAILSICSAEDTDFAKRQKAIKQRLEKSKGKVKTKRETSVPQHSQGVSGIRAEHLEHGGFHIKSAENRLAPAGKDKTFVPVEPMPRSHSDMARVRKEWDQITGEKFGYPCRQLYNEHLSGTAVSGARL